MTPEELITIVTKYFVLAPGDIKTKTRKGEIIYARSFVIIFLSIKLKLSDRAISECLKCVERSNVTIARNKLKEAIAAAVQPVIADYIALNDIIPEKAEIPFSESLPLAKAIVWMSKENKDLKEENEKLKAKTKRLEAETGKAMARFVINMHESMTIPEMGKVWGKPYHVIKFICTHNGLKAKAV